MAKPVRKWAGVNDKFAIHRVVPGCGIRDGRKSDVCSLDRLVLPVSDSARRDGENPSDISSSYFTHRISPVVTVVR